MANDDQENDALIVRPMTMSVHTFVLHRRSRSILLRMRYNLHTHRIQRQSRPKGYTEQLEKRLAKMEEMLAVVCDFRRAFKFTKLTLPSYVPRRTSPTISKLC